MVDSWARFGYVGGRKPVEKKERNEKTIIKRVNNICPRKRSQELLYLKLVFAFILRASN
jgi:hypothetical protein